MAEIDHWRSILAVPPDSGPSTYWSAAGPICTGRYGPYRSKEEEEKKKKKKRRRSTSHRPSGDSARGSPASRRHPRCPSAIAACVALAPSPVGFFSPHAGESSRRQIADVSSLICFIIVFLVFLITSIAILYRLAMLVFGRSGMNWCKTHGSPFRSVPHDMGCTGLLGYWYADSPLSGDIVCLLARERGDASSPAWG
ncbi:hypothetical protein BHM03_00059023 [Ensete ventricosum]|nr:hypothetical protein BHM03_00059023 [Ensete ventricosum]